MTESLVYINTSQEVQPGQQHSGLCNVNEADLINAHNPNVCPNCGSLRFVRFGKTRNGVNRFLCKDCGKTFTPVTGTIFENHKISIREWMDFCRSMFSMFSNINTCTEFLNSRNAITTSRYWLEKLFLILDGIQDDIVLSGTVQLDEFFISENEFKPIYADAEVGSSVRKKKQGKLRHQYCIVIAADGTNILLFYDRIDDSITQTAFNTFCSHIAPGTLLIYNGEAYHSQLVQSLSENGGLYVPNGNSTLDVNGDSLIQEFNSIRSMLIQLIQNQSRFKQEEIQGYLNMYAFVINPPSECEEKIDIILNRAFLNHMELRYRDFYKKI
ncbi:MAG: hypothetical protein LUC91_02065 [Prevotella sp.]|nr:hypothetical protein [Prevotella sp.]